jgi:chaperone required for assembly of F1-ATPase
MRRFWREVTVEPEGAGFAVRLDGRPLRTPAKAPCLVPSRALAEAMAAEWQAQGDAVEPAAMPLTRAANSAIDRVEPEFDAVAATVAAYGETDLICYRAPFPEGLAARQAQAWDPLAAWAAETLAAPLVLAEGVMHVAQGPESLARLARAVRAHSPWELTALHDLVTLSGSLVIGLAVSHGRLEAETAWPLSRIDEDWNIAEWGEDAEAAEVAARRRADFLNAARLLALLRVQRKAPHST